MYIDFIHLHNPLPEAARNGEYLYTYLGMLRGGEGALMPDARVWYDARVVTLSNTSHHLGKRISCTLIEEAHSQYSI